jgi:biopolymer transport protein ExbB
MLSNIVVQTFIKGGWVMWPILAVFFLALCVLLDRAFWWLRLRSQLQPSKNKHAKP